MHLLAVITDLASAARFPRHQGEPIEPPKRAPARDPPYWQSKSVRRHGQSEQSSQLGCSKSTEPRLHGPGARELWWPTRAAARRFVRVPGRPRPVAVPAVTDPVSAHHAAPFTTQRRGAVARWVASRRPPIVSPTRTRVPCSAPSVDTTTQRRRQSAQARLSLNGQVGKASERPAAFGGRSQGGRLHCVRSRRWGLTPRQQQVAWPMAKGETNNGIAQALAVRKEPSNCTRTPSW